MGGGEGGKHIYVLAAYMYFAAGSNITLLIPILPCEIIFMVPVKNNDTCPGS